MGDRGYDEESVSSRQEQRAIANRKVLMLSYVFPPFFSIGGSVRVVKFIKYLPKIGWRPVVLTIDDTQEYDTQRREGSEELLQDVPDDIKIYRTKSGEPSMELLDKGREVRRRNRLAALIINFLGAIRSFARRYILVPDENITWLPFALKLGRQIVRSENIDVIFATCPPHSVAIVGAILKILTRKPLVLDFRDDWIDTPWHRSKPWIIRQIERWMEHGAVKAADKVALVTEWSRDLFVNRYPGEPEQKFVFIPNGVDLHDFGSLKETKERHRNSKFTLVHAGLLSESEEWKRSPQGLFEAICRIREEHPTLARNLTITFTGALPAEYRRMARSLGIGDAIQEVGFLQRQALIDLMSDADLLIAVNYEGFASLIPGKIYEYWAVGGPPILLLSTGGAAQRLVRENELGIAVDPFNDDMIGAAILEAYQRREAGSPMRIANTGIQQYDRRSLSGKLADVLDAVVDWPTLQTKPA